MIVKRVASLAEFSLDRMGKTTIAQGEALFAGLNSFEPGQEHAPHTHAEQDKLYVVLEGNGEIHIGAEAATVTAGDTAFAPAGVVHSIRNPGPGRLVVMAVLAPPPGPKR
jgi:quercetin dioxygenase-like cupin family protein